LVFKENALRFDGFRGGGGGNVKFKSCAKTLQIKIRDKKRTWLFACLLAYKLTGGAKSRPTSKNSLI